ncbi:hypothetical protein OIU79_011333 [Salix purpurea]|uniref:Uncharacterized protein n=1 Tax=Salix purpurea TaxID=77065 RepID=A0A9Q0Q0M5_SALPP|nr:hypothetical protein OIU79_011333 [Salix purpurea]
MTLDCLQQSSSKLANFNYFLRFFNHPMYFPSL